MILFDTNILVYVHNRISPYHKIAYFLETEVLKGKLSAAISTQNILEFYSTVTNPQKLNLPLTLQEAGRVIRDYLASPFQIIHPHSGDFDRALYFAIERKIKGRKIFDLYLIATMLSNSVDTIYTVNDKDFEDFSEIKVVNPFKINKN